MRNFTRCALGFILMISLVACKPVAKPVSSEKPAAPATQATGELTFSKDLPEEVPDATSWKHAGFTQDFSLSDVAAYAGRDTVPAIWLVREGLCPNTHTACTFSVLFEVAVRFTTGDGREEAVERFIFRTTTGKVCEEVGYLITGTPPQRAWVRESSGWRERTTAEMVVDSQMFTGLERLLVKAIHEQESREM